MWTWIALILISLGLILGLIALKVRKLRRGEMGERTGELESPLSALPKINFPLIKTRAFNFLAKWSHVSVLILLKLRIKSTYFLKRKKEVIMPKVKNILSKALPKSQGVPKKPGVVSKFLKNVSDYKKKLKKIEQKMKEEEIKKTEE